MSYKKNLVSNFAFQIAKILLGFGSSVIIARALGAEGQGTYSYLILVFGLLGSYGHLGILNATTFFQKRSSFAPDDVFSTNMLYCTVNAVVLTLIMWIAKASNTFLTDYEDWMLALGLLYILLSYLQILLTSFYVGDERIYKSNAYLFYGNLLYLALLFILFALGQLSVSIAVILNIIMHASSVIFLMVNLRINFKPAINFTLLKAEFKYGIVLYFASLFIFLNYRVDQFMINYSLGKTELGIYSIGVRLAELLFLIPDSVTSALLGRLYNIKIDDASSQKSVLIRTTKYTFYMTLVLLVIGIMLVPLVPYVYGDDFSRAKEVIVLLFIGIVFASIAKVSYSYFTSKGKPIVHLCVTALTLSTNIVLNLFFIPIWGINGAALASTISYTVYGLSYLIIFRVMERIPFRDFFYISKEEIHDLVNLFKNAMSKIFRR